MEKEKLTGEGPAEDVRSLEAYLLSLGLDLFGYTDADVIRTFQPFYDARPDTLVSVFETGAPEEKCRQDGSYLSIAFPYAHELIWPREAHFSVYARGTDYHRIAGSYLERICAFIQMLGYAAEPFCDSCALPERLIAVLSGIGYIGYNQMLITKQYGSFVFLGEIKTDLPLPANQNFYLPDDHSPCASCRRCVAACPTKILGTDLVRTNRCLSCLTQMKQHSKEELLLLDGRLFGCDTCQRVCPWNKDKAGRGLPDFAPFDFMAEPDLMEIARMTKDIFMQKYRQTSAGWRGKAVLTKNALTALARLDRLPADLHPDSPVVKAVYDRLRQRE